MMCKVCKKCNTNKPLSEFHKNSSSIDGYYSMCKSCKTELALERIRTRDGLISNIYASQRNSSKKRGHKPPEDTLEEVRQWMFRKPKFETLFQEWVRSKYSKYNG